MNPKLALINIYFVDYKMPLFELLHKNYDITYLITRKSKEHTESIKGTQGFKVKHFSPIYFGRIPFLFKILKELIFSNYDVIITHDPHTFESFFGFIITKLKRKKFLFYSETWDWPRRKLSIFMDLLVKIMFIFTDAGIVSSKISKDYC